MYLELSGEKIKECENELAKKLEVKLALTLDCKIDYRLGRELDHKGIITSFHWKNNQLPSFKNNHTYTLG